MRRIGTPASDDEVVFELKSYTDGKDYCDAHREAWVWSIGRRYSDDRIFASLDGRFYGNEEYECLWLR